MASKDVKVDLNVNGDVSASGVLKSTNSAANEGGEIQLSLPSSGSTLSSGVNIDVYQNKLRIFEAGGDNRGAYIDISGTSAGVGTNLVGGGSASDSFKTIAVSGQDNVVADSSTDTLTLINGTNITITTNATNDSVTINSTGNFTSVDSIVYPDYITFDTTPETVPTAAGSIYWDSGESAPGVILNANVELRLGQEEVVLVKNATGSSIPKGSVVYINGAAGQRPTIALADADTEATSSKTLGLTAETIADEAEGFVTTFGVLRGVNTDGLTEGAMLWLSSTAGGYTTTVPAEPAHSVFLGYVVKANASSGEIFVSVQNGYELNELHGVTVEDSGSLTDNEVLSYDTSSGLWKNQTHTEAGLVSGVGTNKISYQTTAPSSPATGDIWIDSDYTLDSLTQYMIIAVSDETTYLTTGTAKVTFRAPFAMTLPQIPRASLTTASTSGVVTVDINESGTSILSTKLSIDASEKTSTTAATAAVLSDTSIADDAEITIDIDAAGTSAAGLKIVLYYKRA